MGFFDFKKKTPAQKALESQREVLEKQNENLAEEQADVLKDAQRARQTAVTKIQGQGEMAIDKQSEVLANRGEITGAAKADINLKGQEQVADAKATAITKITEGANEVRAKIADQKEVLDLQLESINEQIAEEEENADKAAFGAVASLVGGAIDIGGMAFGIPPGFGSAAAGVATGINSGDSAQIMQGLSQGIKTTAALKVGKSNTAMKKGMKGYFEKKIASGMWDKMTLTEQETEMNKISFLSNLGSKDFLEGLDGLANGDNVEAVPAIDAVVPEMDENPSEQQNTTYGPI